MRRIALGAVTERATAGQRLLPETAPRPVCRRWDIPRSVPPAIFPPPVPDRNADRRTGTSTHWMRIPKRPPTVRVPTNRDLALWKRMNRHLSVQVPLNRQSPVPSSPDWLLAPWNRMTRKPLIQRGNRRPPESAPPQTAPSWALHKKCKTACRREPFCRTRGRERPAQARPARRTACKTGNQKEAANRRTGKTWLVKMTFEGKAAAMRPKREHATFRP